MYSDESNYIYFPKEIGLYESKFALGLNVSILPRMIAEEELRQIPQIEVNYRLGLPYRLSFVSRLSGNYIANQLSVGVQYSHSIGNLSIALGDMHSIWIGFAQLDGFNNYAEGWINQPYVSLGYKFDKLYVSMKGEINYTTSEKYYAGDVMSLSQRNYLAGTALSMSLEQPFWKGNEIILGAKLNYNRSNYKYWIAFYTTRDFFFFPEIFFGYIW
jgi:hypothetical protein